MTRPIRVLMGKIGLDGHDRGAKVVVSALRDAGMEVIYSGLHNSAEGLVRASIEEDVDVIGISILSGAHLTLIPRLMEELKKEKFEKTPVILGGIIPPEDVDRLKAFGVREVFTPGTRLDVIVDTIQKMVSNTKTKK